MFIWLAPLGLRRRPALHLAVLSALLRYWTVIFSGFDVIDPLSAPSHKLTTLLRLAVGT